MAKPGDTVAERYTLTESVSSVPSPVVQWSGQDSAGQPVRITVYTDTDSNFRTYLREGIERLGHLVNPAIVPIITVEETASELLLVSPGGDGTPLTHMTWLGIVPALQALEYAHRLGYSHGYLSPDTICLDSNGHIRLFNFGLPVSENRWSNEDVSLKQPDPVVVQIRRDRFAMACAIHEAMTGQVWNGRIAEGIVETPLGQAVATLIDADGRGIDLSQLRQLVVGHLENTTHLVPDTRENTLPSPRSTTTNSVPASGSRSIPLSWAIGGLAAMAVLAVLFAAIAPGTDDTLALPEVRPALAQQAVSSEPSEPSLTPLEQARQEHYQSEGRELADEILRLQVQLEDVGVSLWATEAWDRSRDMSDEADTAFRDTRFEDAMTGYRATRDLLQETFEQRTVARDRFLQTGREALLAGDHQRAIIDLSIVNSLDPELPEIDALLTRAENLAETIDLTRRGIALMSARDYEAAEQSLSAAFNLDPDWAPANNARKELQALLQVIAFNDVMSAGFAALADDNFQEATKRFEEAALVQPDSEAPKEALAQVSTQNQSSKVQQLLADGAANNQAERWQASLDAYSAAIELDPTVVTAVSGATLAEVRIKLDDDMEGFIAHPIRLTTDDGLSQARQLLQSAARARPAGPRLRRQTDQLAAFISVARIPVDLVIESDRETDVTIYKVSNLGRIASESMTLAPGAYTVVGKRRGYRDVRHELTLLGGQPPATLYVACNEKVQP